jgi:uncharacterized SAM-binding protein YcdF (DUF218 family)
MDTLFFVLSKILFFLINPLTWIGILMILAVIAKNREIGRKIGIAALVVFLIFSNTALQNKIMRWWEIETPPVDAISRHYRYAIVLGGMPEFNPQTGRLVVERSIDRVLHAVVLYKAGKVQKIIITGGSGRLLNQGWKEAPDIKIFCCRLGVRPEDVLVEDQSRNTYENAKFTKALFPYDREKVLLITSAFHMRRSMAIFKKAGYHFDILTSDPIAGTLSVDDYLLPKAKALDNWLILIKEMVGYGVYRIMGYL